MCIFILLCFFRFILNILSYDISFLLNFEGFKNVIFLYNLLNNIGYFIYILLNLNKFMGSLLCIFAIYNIILFVKLIKLKSNNIHKEINKYTFYVIFLSVFTFFNFL